MKTSLCVLASLAASYALVSVPIDFAMLVSALFVTGFLVIAVSDYRHVHRRARRAVAHAAPAKVRQALRLAA